MERVAINADEQDADGEWEIAAEQRVIRGNMVAYRIDGSFEWFRRVDILSESFPEGPENAGSIVIRLRLAEQRGFA